MVIHTLTHRHTCMTREFSGLLLSSICTLISNNFCFVLLPESSLCLEDPGSKKKRANLCGLRTCIDSHVRSPASKWCTRRSPFLHPKETPEGIPPRTWIEKLSIWKTAQLPPGTSGRRMIRVHRSWAEPGFIGESVPDMSGTLASGQDSDEKQEFPHCPWPLCQEHSFVQQQCVVQAVEGLVHVPHTNTSFH